jgi:hypothetical protein
MIVVFFVFAIIMGQRTDDDEGSASSAKRQISFF